MAPEPAGVGLVPTLWLWLRAGVPARDLTGPTPAACHQTPAVLSPKDGIASAVPREEDMASPVE